ncbi:hypothetical protein C8R47DRAFT_1075257 [Mycena vitilis]|nr:hypothetical protein C8R47DRAFT_1075257 [Mycena vitilis]
MAFYSGRIVGGLVIISDVAYQRLYCTHHPWMGRHSRVLPSHPPSSSLATNYCASTVLRAWQAPSLTCSRKRKQQEQREKSRLRMARYRENLKAAPPEKQEASKERARAARARYREKEFTNKYGFEAYERKVQRRAERAQRRSERMRRKQRPQARGKPRKRAPRSVSEDDEDESGSDSSVSSDTDTDPHAPLRRFK